MNIKDITGTTKLANGVEMPYLGLGVYKAKSGEEVYDAVKHALKVGYRLIDTASFYGNEEGVGKALRDSGLQREEIFVTTKLWIDDQGKNSTLKAFEASQKRLNIGYIDLYLIHWPVPGKYLESWKVLQEIYDQGRVKAIGVSNCLQHHLESLKVLGGTAPMVLQNEFHPKLVQQELLDYCKKHKIQYQAWSPLMRGELLSHPVLKQIAEKYQKSTAQVLIRWDLEKGVASIPKSVHKNRIEENMEIFDFNLKPEEIAQISALEDGTRTGAHPDHFMEHFKN